MNLFHKIRSTKNAIDFTLRGLVKIGYPVRETLPQDLLLQKEMENFFAEFQWEEPLKLLPSKQLQVIDVGARNFCLAPVFRKFFASYARDVVIHGIEIDAYRRLTNLHIRKDYADFFVSCTPGAKFHASDFLTWGKPADIIFLLNPFVTPRPLLAWGLPMKHFRPERLFQKVGELLSPQQGLLFITNPSRKEAEITQAHLKHQFRLLEMKVLGTEADLGFRIGMLFRKL